MISLEGFNYKAAVETETLTIEEILKFEESKKMNDEQIERLIETLYIFSILSYSAFINVKK